MDLENTQTIALYNGEQLLLYPNEQVISYSKIYDTFYKKITKKDVDAVINKYFKKSNMSVSLVSENLPSFNKIKEQCEKIIG
jgi:hypothetical protein